MSSSKVVAVVGAGGVGLFATRELLRRGHRVVLLDAACQGERVRDDVDGAWLQREYPIQSRSASFGPSTHHLFASDREFPYHRAGAEEFLWIRSLGFGGRMNLWGGVCFRMSDRDFRAADADGCGIAWPGWASALDDDYAYVERLLGLEGRRDGFEQLPDSVLASEIAPDALDERLFSRIARMGAPVTYARRAVRDGRCFSATDFLRGVPGAVKRLHFASGALVTRVVLGRTVEAVELLDRARKRRFAVDADAVFLCASPIENCRILLASLGRRRLSSLPHLGRNLMDHLGGPRGLEFSGWFRGPRAERGRAYRHLYIPRFQNMGARTERYSRGFATHLYVRQVEPGLFRFAVNFNGEQLPDPDNRVTLRRSTLSIHVAKSANDRAIERAMSGFGRNLAEVLTRGGGAFRRSGRNALGLCLHEGGVYRLSSDPQDGVVDCDFQVHGVRGLYLSDVGVFPSLGTQNPTLTALALTRRAVRGALR